MMRIRRTERFKAAYWLLQTQTRARVDKALFFFAANPRHPSLRLERMRGQRGVWEISADRQHRVTLEIREGYYLLRNVGKHEETPESP